jgi:Ca2+-binding EF-hand superfamily protein
MWELRAALVAMGQTPSDEDLFDLIAEVDADGSGSITFNEFVVLIEKQQTVVQGVDDSETIAAFVALGGRSDRSGQISADKLVKAIRNFELTIDIEQLIEETDTDGSGFIDFEEFAAMLCPAEEGADGEKKENEDE